MIFWNFIFENFGGARGLGEAPLVVVMSSLLDDNQEQYGK